MAYGSITDQGTIDSSYDLHNQAHKGASTLYHDPFTDSDHFITSMVRIDIYHYGACLLIVATYGSGFYTHLDSYFSSSYNKI